MKHSVMFALVAALLWTGCVTERVYREPPLVRATNALTLAQIKEMTAKGVSDETILSALRASRVVYRLSADNVKDLQAANVSQAVIDYLLSTAQRPLPRPVVRRYYYYPPPYPYWGWYDWHWGGHFDFGHHGFGHGGHH